MPLLTVEDLRTHFHTRAGVVRAVDGVSFHVEPGETLGIVGESGSGKSVTGLSLMGLVPMPPGRIESGTAQFNGLDLLHCSKAEHRAVRGKRIAMIFQDPMTALNPYMRAGAQIHAPAGPGGSGEGGVDAGFIFPGEQETLAIQRGHGRIETLATAQGVFPERRFSAGLQAQIAARRAAAAVFPHQGHLAAGQRQTLPPGGIEMVKSARRSDVDGRGGGSGSGKDC